MDGFRGILVCVADHDDGWCGAWGAEAGPGGDCSHNFRNCGEGQGVVEDYETFTFLRWLWFRKQKKKKVGYASA
jgi:hypothetical protein